MSDIYTPHVGFELGWDMAASGRFFDLTGCNTDIRDGFRAGRMRFPRPGRNPDRFEIKCLQLRLGALPRNRIVQPEITPAYLRFIDTDVCPVTLVRLTHSTRSDTDWSIDRINNSGAYADANLMVISTRANRIKNNLMYDDVLRLSRDNAALPDLTRVEWGRLACLMYGAHHLDRDDTNDDPGALLTEIPRRCRAPLYFHFQQALLTIVRDAPIRNLFLKALNAQHPEVAQQQRLKIAAERLALLTRHLTFPFDALADDRVQSWLKSWFLSFPAQMAPTLIKIAAVLGRPDFNEQILERWALPSHGYFVADSRSRP